ncbi:MAG: NAD(+)/NADH kinase [Firmicutes bacterium]|nr:NAD(+)/NADH kinase [Bacillota bacterium]
MKKFAIIPNNTKDIDYKYTKKLCGYLKGKAETVMSCRDKKSGIDTLYSDDALYADTDAVIILGGDGTMLQVAEPCGKNAIPVMGINLGRIGFMTEVETDDMESACDKLISGDFKVEERMMMEICITHSDGRAESFIALNDAVISKCDSKMVSLELLVNGEDVSKYIADGLIISTPTGSTGYSLSAGGPVADPTMSLFIATPVCAHMLSARPMLMSDHKNIVLRLENSGSHAAYVLIDGEERCSIGIDDVISIKKSKYSFKIIKLGKQSFYYTMMAKL